MGTVTIIFFFIFCVSPGIGNEEDSFSVPAFVAKNLAMEVRYRY
jgi:hypothetical protein